MPNRKQRRRRDKSFRHEYETVLLDDEGNETPIAELREERQKERAEKKPAAAPAKGGGRFTREPPAPTWKRALRRGGLMGGAIFVAFVFVLHGGSLRSRAFIAIVYALAFIPLTYWVDHLAYRSHQKRMAKLATKKN